MKEVVVEKIRSTNKAMISYAEYMNFVLYDPKVGYYMSDRKKLGKEGDFYTSSGVHAVFGQAFAHFFLDVIEKENLPAVICEIGGGDGRFAHAVMTEWEKITKNRPLTYTIIETSFYHRSEQMKRLHEFSSFQQFASLKEYRDLVGTSFDGIIFSNELLDAFPVHVVEKHNNELYEIFVSVDLDGNLVEKKEICTNEEVINWLNNFGPPVSNKQRIEVPIYMNDWLLEIDEFLTKGLVVTIDYGYSKEEWTMPERRDGSLRGYYKHQMINDPLQYPTEMDLTTHIHLDAYSELMNELGFKEIVSVRQNRFLLMIGMLKFLQENYDPNPFSEKSKLNRAVQTLLNDSGMSAAFHVFLHGKNSQNQAKYKLLIDDPYKI